MKCCFLSAFLLDAFFLLLNCTPTTPDYTGNLSQTGNGIVAGIVYQSDGKTPAESAGVVIHGKDFFADTTENPSKSINTIFTDADGKFTLCPIDTGAYVIEISDSNNNRCLIDSVHVISLHTCLNLRPAILKPAGAVKGLISLSEGGDPRKVLVLVFGIDRFARVDTDGSFRISNLAEGRYDLRFISSLDNYGILDMKHIAVTSAHTTDIDTVKLPFTGIPVSKNVKVSYDTLKQIVSLSWNKPERAVVNSFNVYRKNLDSNTVSAVPLNKSPVTDTIFFDSTGIQNQTYEYNIVAVDKNGNEGVKSGGVSVKVVGAFGLSDSIGCYGTEQNRLFKPLYALMCENYYVVFDAVDPYPSAVYAKFFDLSGNFLKAFIIRQSSITDNIIHLKSAVDNKKNLYVVFNDTTFEYDIDGNLISKIPLNIPEILTGTVHVGADDSVLIYAVNRERGTLSVRNLTGDTVLELIFNGGLAGGLGVATSDKNGNIFISDNSAKKIYKYGPDGNPLTVIGKDSLFYGFGSIDGMTVDSLGNIYVDDSQNDFVYIFSSDGTPVGRFQEHLNTSKWGGTAFDNSEHQSFFINSQFSICILEGNSAKRLFVYKEQR